MILSKAARAAYAKAIAIDTPIDARVIRADGSGTETTATEGADLKDASERAWADYREAKNAMEREEQVAWLKQLADGLAANNWTGTTEDKVTFWEIRATLLPGSTGTPDWYDKHDHDLVVRFMEAQ